SYGYGDSGLRTLLGAPGRRVKLRPDEGVLPALRNLRRLSLSRNGVTDPGLRALARSPLAETLTHLDLSENERLTASGIRALVNSRLWPRLEGLNLANLHLADGEAIELVVQVLPRSQIRRLGLQRVLHWEAGMSGLLEALASAPSWGSLEALDLSGN